MPTKKNMDNLSGKRKTTRNQKELIVTWLETERNFKLITGGLASTQKPNGDKVYYLFLISILILGNKGSRE